MMAPLFAHVWLHVALVALGFVLCAVALLVCACCVAAGTADDLQRAAHRPEQAEEVAC